MKIIKENWLGLLGLIGLCVAIPLPEGLVKNIFNLIGFVGLIVYAWRGKNAFFFYFELVALLGNILNIMGVGDTIKFTLLVIASLAALIRVLMKPEYRQWYTIFGVIGLGGLVYGYAAFSNWGYTIGGIGMVLYSAVGFYQGVQIALIFGLLNVIYGGISIYMLLMGK